MFSVGELHAASKTSSANGPHLNVWDFDISAGKFPHQKRASLVWIGPKVCLTYGQIRQITIKSRLHESECMTSYIHEVWCHTYMRCGVIHTWGSVVALLCHMMWTQYLSDMYDVIHTWGSVVALLCHMMWTQYLSDMYDVIHTWGSVMALLCHMMWTQYLSDIQNLLICRFDWPRREISADDNVIYSIDVMVTALRIMEFSVNDNGVCYWPYTHCLQFRRQWCPA